MKALLFDTETTGLVDTRAKDISLQPQVIEFYGCILDMETFEVSDEFEFLANPGKPLPDIIKKITGINDDMLRNEKPFSANYEGLQAFFKKAEIAAAHNLSFDRQLINFEAQRMTKIFHWPARMVCTVEATEHVKGHRLSMSKMYEHLFPGETFPGAHRAKADVMALKRCFIELVKQGLV